MIRKSRSQAIIEHGEIMRISLVEGWSRSKAALASGLFIVKNFGSPQWTAFATFSAELLCAARQNSSSAINLTGWLTQPSPNLASCVARDALSPHGRYAVLSGFGCCVVQPQQPKLRTLQEFLAMP